MPKLRHFRCSVRQEDRDFMPEDRAHRIRDGHFATANFFPDSGSPANPRLSTPFQQPLLTASAALRAAVGKSLRRRSSCAQPINYLKAQLFHVPLGAAGTAGGAGIGRPRGAPPPGRSRAGQGPRAGRCRLVQAARVLAVGATEAGGEGHAPCKPAMAALHAPHVPIFSDFFVGMSAGFRACAGDVGWVCRAAVGLGQ